MVVHLPLEQAVEVRILVPQPIRHLHSHAVEVFFMVVHACDTIIMAVGNRTITVAHYLFC